MFKDNIYVVEALTSPCPVGTGLLAFRTDTLFTPAPFLGTGVSIYMLRLDVNMHVSDGSVML